MPMTIGAINLPKKIPNLNQILLRGLKIFEFKIPKIKKSKAMANAHILIPLLFNKGHRAIIKKNHKKNCTKTSI